MTALHGIIVWSIAIATILAILVRPRRWPEAAWACAGAALLVLSGQIAPSLAFAAARKGFDVYLFLTGMMVLSELARLAGVFDWLAGLAVTAARGSRARLFSLVYGVGILVTALLSNDATAVVLTPAVYAAIRKARVEPMPYMFACAFIANAASFVLPVSNPANLVLYGSSLPSLWPWLRLFFLPSLASIGATWAVLYWISRPAFAGPMRTDVLTAPLTAAGKRAAWGIALTGAVLLGASALGWALGMPTVCAALLAVLAATRAEGLGKLLRGVAWSVLPLVAGLFILVEALNTAGALQLASGVLQRVAPFRMAGGSVTAAFGVAALANVVNNLPAGLLTSGVLQTAGLPPHIRHALLLGVDLGPNLSVTGSLATILWLVALRREGVQVSVRAFLKAGSLVMPPALLLAALALAV